MRRRKSTSPADESSKTWRMAVGHFGFKVAKAATDTAVHTAVLSTNVAFSLARGCCVAVEGAVLTLPMFSRMSSLVSSTHGRVQRVLDVTEDATVTSVRFSGLAVESCLKYLTGKRVLEEGTELAGIAESVVEFYQLARGFCYDLRLLGLLELVRALYAIAALQRVFGPLSVPCPLEESGTAAASPPPAWQIEELHTMTKYSTASYGRLFLSMWDKNASLLSLTEAEVIAKYTGGLPEWVLHREEATLFRPAHFLAVDHDLRMVVVAIRGTLGVSDTLCDLTCESAEFIADGLQGEVHSGFLRAAEALDSVLRPLVAETLLRFQGYRLRICGHSMGAATAALLAALWRKDFPQLHCFGFGPACTASFGLSQALASHVTSVVLGNDFVSRLSLGTATDLRNAVYTLCRDAEPGLLERISVEAMNVLRHRQKDESSQKSSGPEAASPLHSPRTSTQPEEPSGSQECDPGLSLLFLKSVAKALRASMQAPKLVPAGAVYHLHTVGAKTAQRSPSLRRTRSTSQSLAPPGLCVPSASLVEPQETLGEMRRVDANCFGELILSRTNCLVHSPSTYECAMRSYCGGLEWQPNILHRLVLRMRRDP